MHGWQWTESARKAGVEGICVTLSSLDWGKRHFDVTASTLVKDALPLTNRRGQLEFSQAFHHVDERMLREHWSRSNFFAAGEVQTAVKQLLRLPRVLSVEVARGRITVKVWTNGDWAEVEPMVLEILGWRLFDGRKITVDQTDVKERNPDWMPWQARQTFDQLEQAKEVVRIWSWHRTEKTFALTERITRKKEDRARRFTCLADATLNGNAWWTGFFAGEQSRAAVKEVLALAGVCCVSVNHKYMKVGIEAASDWSGIESAILQILFARFYQGRTAEVIKTPGAEQSTVAELSALDEESDGDDKTRETGCFVGADTASWAREPVWVPGVISVGVAGGTITIKVGTRLQWAERDQSS